ncbi:uncharacterized protein PAC_13549 [Phialocephala subalpina]|uniref:V-SNARE coiled-coil homology domain-containing protein n=1 Tax=Phialocephala subalpina TaxID=576137 RepID=A0A1L7XF48_9HELO|nr:uncharacterized protein PAC_13549 [Phialocephala subalpina]
MAEAIAALGIIASITQLADYGFKLSIKLYTFSSTISTASTTISSISNDVSLTSTVLKELCQIIKSDDAHVVSENAILATKQTVDECLKIFGELDDALSKCLVSVGLDKGEKGESGEMGKLRKRRGNVVERLKWPFKQPKMELLRSNLDRLKASLTLMLQVLSYARDVSNRNEAASSLQYQKQIIESLARSEHAMKRRYYALKHALEGHTSGGTLNATINSSVNTMASRDTDDEPPEYQHPSPAAKISNPVGELLLCFRLISDLLEHHSTTTKDGSLADPNPDVFQEALNLIRKMEIHKLEQLYGDQPNHAKVQSLKNIQTRLRGLVQPSHGGVFVELSPGTEKEEVEAIKRQIRYMKDEDVSSARSALPHIQPGALGATGAEYSSSNIEKEKPPRYDDRSDDEATISVPAASPSNDNSEHHGSDSLQAQIDATVGVMRETINKVTQRGERLDSLQGSSGNDKPVTVHQAAPGGAGSQPKTSDAMQAKTGEIAAIMRKNIESVTERGDHRLIYGRDDGNLSEQSKRFYLEAKRRQSEGLLAKAYRSVAEGIARVGSEGYKAMQGLYESSSNLFIEPEKDEDGEKLGSHTPQHGNILEGFQELEEEEEEEGDENIVDDLLSQWTTLKVKVHDHPVEGAAASANVQS